jgi:DNA-directed RNA polymerase specialized sigma24 family protein
VAKMLTPEDLEYITLLGEAHEAASKRMGGQRVGIYDVDDIAQEMMVNYYLIALDEPVENAGAMLTDLAFKAFSNAVRREKRRRMEHPDFDLIADDCFIVQRWERAEIVDEQIEALQHFAKNDIQRGIVLHARLGMQYEDSMDSALMMTCMGVSRGNLATQKSRLIKTARECVEAGGLRTAVSGRSVPRCRCPVWKMYLARLAARKGPYHLVPLLKPLSNAERFPWLPPEGTDPGPSYLILGKLLDHCMQREQARNTDLLCKPNSH